MANFFKTHIMSRDIALFYRINFLQAFPWFDKLMRLVSKIFDVGTYTVIIAALFLLMIYKNASLKEPLMLFSVSQIITHVVKRLCGRERPFVNLKNVNLAICVPKDVYSFPSGHTTAAVTLALMMGMWLPVTLPFFSALALLCGISRVYLGVHYPTDVFIGALIPLATHWFMM